MAPRTGTGTGTRPRGRLDELIAEFEETASGWRVRAACIAGANRSRSRGRRGVREPTPSARSSALARKDPQVLWPALAFGCARAASRPGGRSRADAGGAATWRDRDSPAQVPASGLSDLRGCAAGARGGRRARRGCGLGVPLLDAVARSGVLVRRRRLRRMPPARTRTSVRCRTRPTRASAQAERSSGGPTVEADAELGARARLLALGRRAALRPRGRGAAPASA